MTGVKIYLECPKCGVITSIWRLTGRQKEKDHIKDLYCYVCKEITKQVEIRDYEVTG